VYESWYQKLERVAALSEDESRMILRSLVLCQYQRVTDRRTDTSPMSVASIAERDKNMNHAYQLMGQPTGFD